MDIYCGRFAKEPVHGREVKILAPIADGGTSENNLSDMFSANEFSDSVRDTATL